MNITQAINDANLIRPFLANGAESLESWRSWIVALKAIHGLPITKVGDRRLLKSCSGRTKLRDEGFQTTLLLTGRRSGKSRIAAVVGAFEAALAGHEKKLSKGETGLVLVVSPTKSQSRIVRDYIRAIFEVPLLQQEIVAETKEGFELRNGIRIQILAGDFKSVRGFTLVAAIVDEICFFGYGDDDKIKSDTELVRALQPALATTQGRLVCISSPYAMKGWAYTQFKKHHGKNGRVLVWNCPSRTMNPTLPQSIIDEAMEEDAAAARAEYLGLFRDDVVSFVPREVVEACVIPGRQELPYQSNLRYAAFVDMSGGRVDDAALAIGHVSRRKVVIDLIRRYKPPFSPTEVIGQMCRELRKFHITRVHGDNYSAEFTKSAFEQRGIRYGKHTRDDFAKHPGVSRAAKPKSQLYLEFLPRLCSGEVELLDHEVLINQLSSLERKTRSGGRDIVDHGPNGHDDVANVVAGVCEAAIHAPKILRPMEAESMSSDLEEIRAQAAARARERQQELDWLYTRQSAAEEFMDAISSGNFQVL